MNVWGPDPVLHALTHRTLVTVQEISTDSIMRSYDCFKSQSKGVMGLGQELGPGTGDLTHNYSVLLNLGAGSGKGGLEFRSPSFLA